MMPGAFARKVASAIALAMEASCDVGNLDRRLGRSMYPMASLP